MKYTGLKFVGQKIFIESTGHDDVDAAIKTTFKDHYRRTAPLEMRRADVQLICKWGRGEIKPGTLF